MTSENKIGYHGRNTRALTNLEISRKKCSTDKSHQKFRRDFSYQLALQRSEITLKLPAIIAEGSSTSYVRNL
eukprot:6298022-Pyramimonas_sp.AAC.1